MITLYAALFGFEAAASHNRLPTFNSGVFAAWATSPLWAAWRAVLTETRPTILANPGLFFSDQAPMHYLIASGQLTVYPLRAVNNWLLHAAIPSINLERKCLAATTFPHEEINILHMTLDSPRTRPTPWASGGFRSATGRSRPCSPSDVREQGGRRTLLSAALTGAP